MSFLPNAHQVHIDPAKLTYLLTTGKAKFFILHGFDPTRPGELEDALRMHPIQNECEDILSTVHGVKYTVRCSMPSPNSSNPCTFTVWIIDPGNAHARFVTGYASP